MPHRFAIPFLAIFLSVQLSMAQEHKFSTGMGIGTTSHIINGFVEFGSTFGSVFLNSARIANTRNTGEFRISYAYIPGERWHFGGTFSYNHAESDIFKNNEKIGYRNNDFYTLAGESGYFFFKREKWKLYALVGAGISFGTSSEVRYEPRKVFVGNGTLFNFQISPVGIQYGKNWGGFAELGFGYRGVMSFGLFYNL